MKGMHLLPAYYTTTNTKRRKKQKKTKSLIAAEKEHQKFLERMGVNQTKARVAQSVEQGFCKPQAVGSNPLAPTKFSMIHQWQRKKRRSIPAQRLWVSHRCTSPMQCRYETRSLLKKLQR